MADCLFCNLASGSIPCRRAREDDEFLAFHDINPQAPTHVLIIPRRHVASLAQLTERDAPMMGRLVGFAATLARELGLEDGGYRWVINCGERAGQTVPHLHLHLLAGRDFRWPPG